MDARLLAFVGVATLVVVTPGADMALVTRNTLRAGFAAGLRTSAGILSGLLFWAFAAAVGVAALVAASAPAFTALKLAGAAYLIYLGVTTLWRARRRGVVVHHAASDPSLKGMYRQGVVSNLLNPKVGVFYTTLLPQFVDPGSAVLAWTLLLAAIHLAISIVWLAFYAWLVARARDVFRTPRIRRALDALTGTVLLAFGIRVAAEPALDR